MRVIPFPGANDDLVPTLPSADWHGASGGTLIQKAPAVVDGSDLIFDFQVAEAGKFDLAGLTGRSEIRNSIQLHWVSYPNLKTACEAMAKVAGHQWCRQTGVPLILEAIEGATREAVRAAKEGEAQRVIFASYMNALATIVSQLAVHRTIGESAHGIVEWDPFTQGFDDWVTTFQVSKVCVYEARSMERDVLSGVKVKLLALACSPKDLGITLRSMR